MKLKLITIFFSVILITNVCAENNNGSSILQLSVSGNIYSLPSWSVNGSASSSASYNFTSFGNGTVTSTPTTIILNNPSSLGGDSLVITLPSNCKVGSSKVANNDVYFLINSSVYTNPRISDFTSSSGISTAISFKNVTSSGAVSCAPGALTYSY